MDADTSFLAIEDDVNLPEDVCTENDVKLATKITNLC
jgi:hypothetical protein